MKISEKEETCPHCGTEINLAARWEQVKRLVKESPITTKEAQKKWATMNVVERVSWLQILAFETIDHKIPSPHSDP
jgi:hypothetical protein